MAVASSMVDESGEEAVMKSIEVLNKAPVRSRKSGRLCLMKSARATSARLKHKRAKNGQYKNKAQVLFYYT